MRWRLQGTGPFHGSIFGLTSHFFRQESSTATITLDDDDPQTVNRMLIYLYTNGYPEGAIPSSQQPDRATSTRQDPPPSYEASKLPHLRGQTPSESGTSATSLPSKAATPNESTSSASHMMSNALVYAIADKYDLSGLKSLARERVQVLAKSPSAYTKTADFPEVVKVAFDSTPATDCGLRDIIIDLCSSSMDEIMKDGDTAMIDMIQDIGSLGFGILLKTREADKLALERAIAAKSTAKTQLKEALSQKEYAVAQYKRLAGARDVAYTKSNKALIAQELAISQKELAIDQRNQVIVERDAALKRACDFLPRLDSFLTTSQEWTECRNCGLDFNSWLERVGRDDSDLIVQLRCWDCHCRHDLGAGVHRIRGEGS